MTETNLNTNFDPSESIQTNLPFPTGNARPLLPTQPSINTGVSNLIGNITETESDSNDEFTPIVANPIKENESTKITPDDINPDKAESEFSDQSDVDESGSENDDTIITNEPTIPLDPTPISDDTKTGTIEVITDSRFNIWDSNLLLIQKSKRISLVSNVLWKKLIN